MPNVIPTKSRELVKKRQKGRCFGCSTNLANKGGQWAHRRRRREADEHQNCPCNGLYLCRTCHEWAGANPVKAQQEGWNLSFAVSEPSTVPAHASTGEWVTLDCLGNEHPV